MAKVTKNIYYLIQWVGGISEHDDLGDCCPDFSCCNKNIKTPKDIKARYLKALAEDDADAIYKINSMFVTNYYLPRIIKTKIDHETIQ